MKKHLISLTLILVIGFSFLVANAQENQDSSNENNEFQETTTTQLNICDHNNDGVRNLTDVAEFARCKDTFDVDHDGQHDLSDVSLYASNNQDNNFCLNDFRCTPDPVRRLPVNDITPNPSETTTTQLNICDHNNDGVRNLTDVALFATCKDTFDANNDGQHNLLDVTLYVQNNQDNDFCHATFKCVPDPIVPPVPSNSIIGGTIATSTLAICDHNNDDLRNLTDVAIFAGCKDTFDANGDGRHDITDVTLYTQNNQDNYFCRNNFHCQPQSSKNETSVLGKKISSCKIDQDVIGQSNWPDGTLIRGCDMKVYRIENQQKFHIKSLKELLKYIGQRIYNVADEIVDLF